MPLHSATARIACSFVCCISHYRHLVFGGMGQLHRHSSDRRGPAPGLHDPRRLSVRLQLSGARLSGSAMAQCLGRMFLCVQPQQHLRPVSELWRRPVLPEQYLHRYR